jgi:hypothetical protein
MANGQDDMARTHGRCRRGERLRMGAPHGTADQHLSPGLGLAGLGRAARLRRPDHRDAFEACAGGYSSRSRAQASSSSWTTSPATRARDVAPDRGRRRQPALPPPYSPDFNPIENAFAKLKALLRKAAERTVEGLWATIGRIVDTFTPAECADYFAPPDTIQTDGTPP